MSSVESAVVNGGQATVKPAPVIGEGGWAGWLLGTPTAADGTAQALVQIEPEGTRLLVPAELVPRGADGVYRVSLTREALLNAHALATAAIIAGSEAETVISKPIGQTGTTVRQEEGAVIPVIEERLSVTTERVPVGGVRVHKTVAERQEVVERPIVRDEVSVERVAVGRVIEGPPPPVRQEGDVMVVPLLEEVLVVEKRMMLREELRIRLQRVTTQDSQTVTLRREEAHIERFGPDGTGAEAATPGAVTPAAVE